MDTTSFRCSLCMARVATVPVKLGCCKTQTCLTCARDMFGLNESIWSKECKFCMALAPYDTPMSCENFYLVQEDKFEVFDQAKSGMFKCPRKCSFEGTTGEVYYHLKNECGNAYTKCEKCGQRRLRSELPEHVPNCAIRRMCFCKLDIMWTVSEYQKHVEEHTKHDGYDATCKLYADPDVPRKPNMICCKSSLSEATPKGITGTYSGCGCGQLFTLRDYVNHVLHGSFT